MIFSYYAICIIWLYIQGTVVLINDDLYTGRSNYRYVKHKVVVAFLSG